MEENEIIEPAGRENLRMITEIYESEEIKAILEILEIALFQR